jgi:putative colanic acid biosynthesis UDP-glucose lipid carrier transferase
VKPGLTGWAQVNGFRGEIRENEMLRKRVEYDIWYMENWSLWLDMKIIIMTIYVTVRGDKNAY